MKVPAVRSVRHNSYLWNILWIAHELYYVHDSEYLHCTCTSKREESPEPTVQYAGANSSISRVRCRRENTVRLRRMHLAYLAPELLAALPTSNQAAVSTHSLAYTRFTDVFAYGCASPLPHNLFV